jgi:membrane-bound lytic murein transglycosylase F
LSSPLSCAAEPLGYRGYDDQIQHAVHLYWGDLPDWRWWKAQLYQESALETEAVSGVGAAGLCQAMPATFADWARDLAWGRDANPHVAKYCIEGGARYMARLRQAWSAQRATIERHYLALASYNGGMGSILAAQSLCHDARLWADIAQCLPAITGPANALQTTDYVRNIIRWQGMIR